MPVSMFSARLPRSASRLPRRRISRPRSPRPRRRGTAHLSPRTGFPRGVCAPGRTSASPARSVPHLARRTRAASFQAPVSPFPALTLSAPEAHHAARTRPRPGGSWASPRLRQCSRDARGNLPQAAPGRGQYIPPSVLLSGKSSVCSVTSRAEFAFSPSRRE